MQRVAGHRVRMVVVDEQHDRTSAAPKGVRTEQALVVMPYLSAQLMVAPGALQESIGRAD
jgi:hypothetical protein